MSQSKQYTHLYYSVIKSQAENARIGFCNFVSHRTMGPQVKKTGHLNQTTRID